MSTPTLPPIASKHKLHPEKATNQVVKGFLSYQDTGKTSEGYKTTSNIIEVGVFTDIEFP